MPQHPNDWLVTHEIQYIWIRRFLQVLYFRRAWQQILGISVASQKLSPIKTLIKSWKGMKPNSTSVPNCIEYLIYFDMIDSFIFQLCFNVLVGTGQKRWAKVAFKTSAAGWWVLCSWMLYHSRHESMNDECRDSTGEQHRREMIRCLPLRPSFSCNFSRYV